MEQIIPDVRVPTQKPIRDRVTVVEIVSHQQEGEEATQTESRYSRDLKVQEQAYERQCKVGEDWAPLDCGHIVDAGLIIIRNREGRFLQHNPSDTEKTAAAAKVLEVSYGPPDEGIWLVLPGESMRGHPAVVRDLMVRSQSGICRFAITIIPE